MDNIDSDWQISQDYKKPKKEMGNARMVSLVVQELKQRKVSNNTKMDPRIESENIEDLSEDTTEVSTFQKRWTDFVDNTIVTLQSVDGWKLFRRVRFGVAVGLVIAAVAIVLWPVFN